MIIEQSPIEANTTPDQHVWYAHLQIRYSSVGDSIAKASTVLRHDEQTFTTLSDVSVMASGRFGRKFSDGSDGALLSQVIEAHHGADQADCCS